MRSHRRYDLTSAPSMFGPARSLNGGAAASHRMQMSSGSVSRARSRILPHGRAAAGGAPPKATPSEGRGTGAKSTLCRRSIVDSGPMANPDVAPPQTEARRAIK